MSVRVRLAESVPRTATPIAVDTCNEVLMMPEAMPASARGTSAMAMVSSGMNDRPAPTPIRANGAAMSGK
jgi:hypothetical protein